MIDIKDLQIGDWVQCPYGYYKIIILALDNLYLENKEGRCCACRYDEILPISLTPEILEKNGFHYGLTATEENFCGAIGCSYPDKGWCFNEGAGEIKIIFPNETDGGLIRLDNYCAEKYLELVFVKPITVHELQHCLKLAGIDKEITM